MIDRYSITATAEEIAERFSVDVPEFYHARYNASPTGLLPVITINSPQGVSLFYWGTAPDWAKNKNVSEKLINLAAETYAEKPSLKKSMRTQRCIIPADGFYGWKKVGKKTNIPYRFVFKGGDIFSFAALWQEFEDTEGHEIQTFTIFTLPADKNVSIIQERMPVILNPQSEKIWLDKDAEEEKLLEMLSSSATAGMNYYPVSPKISESNIDVPSLIAPTPPADQHGNLTLFD